MVTPGGEVQFLKLMINESSSEMYRKRCRWFTSMIGIKSSLKVLKTYLTKEVQAASIRTCTFFQGRTCRWGLAWRFTVSKEINITFENVALDCAKTRMEYFAQYYRKVSPVVYIIDALEKSSKFRIYIQSCGTSVFLSFSIFNSGVVATFTLKNNGETNCECAKQFQVLIDKISSCLQLSRLWKRHFLGGQK